MLPSNEQTDHMLEVLIDICITELLDYTHVESMDGMENIAVQMVIERYNKLTREGISSAATAAGTEQYVDGYSAGLLKQMNKHRKMVVM